MKQIRRGVFETNSSSTHSLTICSQEQYDMFVRGEMMYDHYGEELVPYSEELLQTEAYRYRRYNNYRNYELETYYQEFTTPSGDKMVAFGEFGYDG